MNGLMNEESGQGAKIILTMLLVPLTIIIFMIMLTISSPLLEELFPLIDNMASDGFISQAGILKMIISLIPTIVIILYVYTMVIELK